MKKQEWIYSESMEGVVHGIQGNFPFGDTFRLWKLDIFVNFKTGEARFFTKEMVRKVGVDAIIKQLTKENK